MNIFMMNINDEDKAFNKYEKDFFFFLHPMFQETEKR